MAGMGLGVYSNAQFCVCVCVCLCDTERQGKSVVQRVRARACVIVSGAHISRCLVALMDE